jgi:hypothetical protein
MNSDRTSIMKHEYAFNMDQDEKLKKQRFASYEVVDTEKTYFSRLEAVYEVFVIPLRGMAILDANDLEIQFGSWDDIYNLSKDLYGKLADERQKTQPLIAKIFLEFAEVCFFLRIFK